MNPAGLQFTAGQVAAMLGADLIGNPDAPIRAVAPVDPGADGALTFIRSAKFAGKWASSACTAALVTKGIDVPDHDPDRRALILVDNADLAVIKILEQITPPPHASGPGVHPSAHVDPAATVADDASIGPNCTVGPGASVGAGSTLISGVALGAHASIGANTLVHPGAVIGDRCVVGNNCILHANVVLGADGFGYVRPSPDSDHIKVPHAGIVFVHDDVEIGAGSCIDRAKFGATTIGRGVKIDNLCQIGHGVTIGERSLICALCGIAGSVTIGKDVTLAGQVGVADNFTIGDGATIAAKSGVISSVPAGESWLGYPARKHSITLQIWGAQTRLHKFFRGQLARNKKSDDDDARRAVESIAEFSPD
ncbi:MAG: UDP-3-O-(3-hydroxymyristoyl)glucosamine N-acyltransferase [Phycisphaerales bacterium]